jgi:hypothetical protein
MEGLGRRGPGAPERHVFIGHNAIVMLDVTIGLNAIVAAGSLVIRDVPEGKIVCGVPVMVIGSVHTLVAFREQQTQALPWADLINRRRPSAHGPALEAELLARRLAHFFSRLR